MAVSRARDALPVTAMFSVAAATVVTGIVLAAIAFGNFATGKPDFLRATGESLMGLIVMAMGTRFAAEGLTHLIKGGRV
jgi:small neutral amino acid transporter SnatA (MarC family)